MNKTLGWIAVVGLLLSGICLSGAAALSDGWRNLRNVPWREMLHDGDDFSGPRDRTVIDRTLTWSGDDELRISVPAEVTFTDAAETKVEAHGPAWLVNQLEMEDGRIRAGRRIRHYDGEKLRLTITAPNVHDFEVNGAAKMTLKDLDATDLSVKVNGAGEVTLENVKSLSLSLVVNGAGEVKVSGESDTVKLKINGAGEGDLSALKVRNADVSISGLGEITVAPTEEAEVSIAGAGEVKLLTRPTRLRTHIAGAGNVSQPDEDEAPSAAPKAPPPKKTPAASSSAPG